MLIITVFCKVVKVFLFLLGGFFVLFEREREPHKVGQ